MIDRTPRPALRVATGWNSRTVFDLDVGWPVEIILTNTDEADPDLAILAHFRGRVANVAARPHKTRGMLLTVSCVDYSIDLAETPIGASVVRAIPTHGKADRLHRDNAKDAKDAKDAENAAVSVA